MPAPEQDLIVTANTTAISFDLEPARNAFHSLTLLTKTDYLSGLGDWVVGTAATLTPEERQRHDVVVIGLFYAANPGQSWASFPVYLEHLATINPFTLRDKLLNTYARILPTAPEACGVMVETPLPIDREAILANEAAFLTFLRQRFSPDNINVAIEAQAYTYVVDPPAMQALIVSHLSHMWDNYLAAEWERVRPMLQDAVRVFRQVDFSKMSRLEAAQYITGQKLDEEHWGKSLEQAEQTIFVPSAHVGPYFSKFKTGRELGVFFGARLPEGARFYAPDLSRAEILVRLSALADDIRLRILKLVAEEGEQRSQDIMIRLELSQSAASRHLQQLTATGYLTERRCDGAKCYRLNPERIESTLRAISAFLAGSQARLN
jgi:DNA-binding transcriptional ArsR family regulator